MKFDMVVLTEANGPHGMLYHVEASTREQAVSAAHQAYISEFSKFLQPGRPYQRRLKGGGVICGVEMDRDRAKELVDSRVVKITRLQDCGDMMAGWDHATGKMS